MKKIERTLSIIKPDCVAKGLVGRVLARIEKIGLRIVKAESRIISSKECSLLYAKTKVKFPEIYSAVEKAMGEGIRLYLFSKEKMLFVKFIS